jgi:U3 small nucleolar RNA-associated protein 4
MTQQKVAVHRCRFVHYLSPAITHIKRSKKFLAVSRQNGTIQLWSPRGATWFHERTIPAPEDPLETICWAGNRLFRATLGGFIDEISLDTLLPINSTSSYGGAVWSMDINPTNDVIAMGCEDGVIRLFRVVEHGLEYLSALEKQNTKVLSLAWHPYKPIVVVGSTDGTVRAVHVDTGRTIHVMTLERARGEETVVWDVLVLKNGTIVCADSLGCITFWDGRTATLLQTLSLHDADVLCLTASQDGKRVFSSGVDQKVMRMELIEQNGQSRWKHTGTKKYHTHDVRSILLMDDKPWDVLVTGGVDTSLIFSGPTQSFDKMKQERLGIIPRGVFSHAHESKLVMTLFDDSCRVWRLADVPDLESYIDQQRVPSDSHSHLLTIKSKVRLVLIVGKNQFDGWWDFS